LSAQVDLRTQTLDVINLIRWEGLTDIVLCGHSYGGFVVSGVADQVPERIRSMVFLDAFVPEHGESLVHYAPIAAEQLMDGWKVKPISAEAFGVNAADRGIGLLNFHAGEAADADLPVRFPGSFLERRPNAAQPNTLAHHRLSPEFLSGRLKWRARVILLCVADKLDSHSTRFPGQGTRAELLQ